MLTGQEKENIYSIHTLVFGSTNSGMSTINEELYKNINIDDKIIKSEIPIEVILDNTNVKFMLNLKD